MIIAFSNDADESVAALVRSLDDLNVQVDIVPACSMSWESAFDVHSVEGLPLIGLRPAGLSNSSMFLKRLIDVAIALVAPIVLAPVFLLVALLIKLDSRGPVFFRQLRMGAQRELPYLQVPHDGGRCRRQKENNMLHMNQHAQRGGDTRMFKAANDPRVTRVGCVLRRFSLDELPQLINVLVDDMSLVGPRPLILEEHRHVEDWAGVGSTSSRESRGPGKFSDEARSLSARW